MEIETLIGKNIEGIPYEYKAIDSSDNSGIDTYLIIGLDQKFISKQLKHIIAITDKEGNIEQVLTDFQGVIDEKAYNVLVLKYGYPNLILKKDIETKKEFYEIKGTTSIETKNALIKCEIEDDPSFIVWDTPNLKMMLTIIRESNKTEVTIGRIPLSKNLFK